MEHPILTAIYRASFTPLGWFEPQAADGLPEGTRQVILIGNAGPAMFARFAHERNPATSLIDEWTRHVVGELADQLAATALFPFTKPYHPFLTWARRAGGGHVSPLGLNIHPRYGLWHAYRAALLFPVMFDLPPPAVTASPCDSCTAKPCLATCPVGAFTPSGYDRQACAAFLATEAGAPCMQQGCAARRGCPVGRDYIYPPAMAQFFMAAFLKARQEEARNA